MTSATIISDLHARGARLEVVGDKLRVHPADGVTPEEIELIRTHKQPLIALLRELDLARTRSAFPWMFGDDIGGAEASKPFPQTAFVPPSVDPGTEHFSLYVTDPDGRWPEFIPGHHVDIRQPSKLQPLLAPPRKTP
jgi:hypothetical protein